MSASVPHIPDNAPFTAEQRAWLNGMLAGLFSAAPKTAAEAKDTKRIAVLYASQSGTAEGLARKLAKGLKAQGHAPTVSTLVGYTPAALAGEEYALILASTYGDGEAPDGVQPFYEQLCAERFPSMARVRYAVFALGDKHYEHFCKFGMELDAKLAALGGNRLADCVTCDLEVEEPFSQWTHSLLPKLGENASLQNRETAKGGTPASELGTAPSLAMSAAEPAFTRERPLLAPLVEKRNLTHPASTKSTMHLAFCIEGTGLCYEAGDACGVIPNNDPNLVAEILQLLQFNGNEQVPSVRGGTTALHDALSRELQITRLNRKMVQAYAGRGHLARLLELLQPEKQVPLETYLYGRGLIDLLLEYPGVIDDPADLVAMLPKLTPRLYSISSSPAAHAGQIHTTVAVVRFKSHNRGRGGVCSTLLADRSPVTERLPIYIQPNKRFRLPTDPEAPMIMIGPGTGVAPFRSFLHERQALGHKGRNWLFFGERSAATDYLYRDELESMHADGHLTRLDTAFSRDFDRKIYVQDRMQENSRELWRWLQDGATVYVCGDASRMAKDVHAALCRITEKEGGMSADAAIEYVAQLKDTHRYHRDVY